MVNELIIPNDDTLMKIYVTYESQFQFLSFKSIIFQYRDFTIKTKM